MIVITGFLREKPKNAKPFHDFPLVLLHVQEILYKLLFSFGKCFAASSNVTNIFEAKRSAILFASPGVISDSCNKTGTLFNHPPITTGTDTKPPFEKLHLVLVFESLHTLP